MNEQGGLRFIADPENKFDREPVVDRDDRQSARDTAPKSNYPFGTILTPDQNTIALAKAGCFQEFRKPSDAVEAFLVRKFSSSKVIEPDERFSRSQSFETPDQIQERLHLVS